MTAGYLLERRRLTATMPPTSATAGRTTTGSQKTAWACCEVRNTGVDLVSLGRMEIWSSCSASHDTVLRKKSRLFCTFRNWLTARLAVPYTTSRALSLVATAARVSGPLGSSGSAFTCPASIEARLVSPHESTEVRA